MGLVARFRDYIDRLVHPTAQRDALTSPRHRAFIAPRLLGCLMALAAIPIYVALRGVPSALEAMVFAWLVLPILIAYFLYAEEDRYRRLVRNMTDVITRHGRNGTVLFVSPAAEPLFGATVKDLRGSGLFDRVHVADRPAYLTALADSAALGATRSVEFRVRRETMAPAEDGQFVWIEMRCGALDQAPYEAGVVRDVVAVMREITHRKEQEEALAKVRAEAERANAAKSRFLATMSHELRTPLNAIIGFSEMLHQEGTLTIDAARRREYAQLINDSGHHLLSVVNGILDMSKIEAGNFEIKLEPFSARRVIEDCCDLLTIKAHESNVELATLLPDDLPDIVADKRSLNQIMLNLVSNAIKFTDRGGKVTVSVKHGGGVIVVLVEDTGVGIDADDLARVGDPFFQARSSYDRRHDGTGLGLSIVKGLLALHGGEIAIESRVGEGTRVRFRLPINCENARKISDVSSIRRAASPIAHPADAANNRVKASA